MVYRSVHTWVTCLVIILLGILPVVAQAAPDAAAVIKMIESAQPGSSVQLPEGTFAVGDLIIPPRVTVKGAGYARTTLLADGHDVGLSVKDNTSVRISDLTIRGAAGAGISISASRDIRVERVRSIGNSIGIVLDNVSTGTVQNSIVAANRMGLVLTKCEKAAIINCTVVNNSSTSLNLTKNRDSAIFNNLFIGSQTGVMAHENSRVALDYNLYVALFVGVLTGEPIRESLPAWRDISGYDRHSVELRVDFADAETGDFHPTTPLPWNLTRTTASDWGVNTLSDFRAPLNDIDGEKRNGAVDLGAYEVTLTSPRPADGSFTVQSGEGVTSAGIYTKTGKKVAALFDNMPLPKGRYPFWLPQGLTAGEYELRLAESNLSLQYVALIGSNGKTNSLLDSPSIDPALIIYDREDRPILFQGGAEDHTHLRSFTPSMRSGRWRIPGGGGAVGAAVDDEQNVYFARYDGYIFKVNAETGAGIPIAGESFRKLLKGVFSEKATGMAYLKGTLFLADPSQHKLFYTGINELTFEKSFTINDVRWPAADAERNLLWVISDDKLLALDPGTGVEKYQAAPVKGLNGLAINHGRMAVSSTDSQQVFVFDCSDPANLRQLCVMGRTGENPLGLLQLDRLLAPGSLAISSTGEVIVLDRNPKLFSADGTFVSAPFAYWGQFLPAGWLLNPQGKAEMHVASAGGTTTLRLDEAMRSWLPGYAFTLPDSLPGDVIAFFNEGKRNYGIWGDNAKGTFLIVRLEGGMGTAILGIRRDEITNAWQIATDSNGDGEITQEDASLPLLGPNGVALENIFFQKDGRLLANGRVMPRSSDQHGMIQYDWTKYDAASKVGKMGGGQGSFNADALPNGGWMTDGTHGAPHRGFGGGLTSIEVFNNSGEQQWSFPVNAYHCTIGSFRSIRQYKDFVLTIATEELDTVFVDYDGLGLGVIGPKPDFRWGGYWHDQDWSVVGFTGQDNKPYLLLGDYVRHGYNWLEIIGNDSIIHASVPISINAAKETILAAATTPAAVHDPTPPTPKVLVKKLAQAMPVDGNSQKWRDLGINPQIIVCPPGIAPEDCSALIRTAWHGDTLYFQVMKFDDVVTMHQPLNYHYKQDSTELALFGGFMGGFKFAITRTTDFGDILYREQFLMKNELHLDPIKAPRVITVLDNAREVQERKLLETIFGVDLSATSVIITEFAIPITYAWDGRPPIKMESGAGFWMGWFIDDNDTPGLDEQNAYPWPVTFSAYGNPDQGGWAILE